MPSALHDRQKGFVIKLGWNQPNSTIKKIERKQNKQLLCIKNIIILTVQRSKTPFPHRNGRASNCVTGEVQLILKNFKAPGKDSVG